jgi:hypothetical protein
VALFPLAIIVAVCAIDLAGGPAFIVISLVVIAPLLAASIVGPRLTGIYALAAFVGAAGVPIWDQIAGPPADKDRAAVAVRLAGIAFGGGIAVAASVVRRTRERRLTALVQMAEAARRAILGPVPAAINGLRFTAMYHSAAEQAAVGGDLYEVLDGTVALSRPRRGSGGWRLVRWPGRAR